MLVIGERINTSRKAMAPAVAARDAAFIQAEARAQVEAGAALIDVNCGTFVNEEPELLKWLVETVQAAVDVPLCLDTPNPAALKNALPVHKGRAMINSITAERERWEKVLPLVLEFHTQVIALTMDDRGMSESAEERLRVAAWLIENLVKHGMDEADIFVDPLVRPVSTGTHYAMVVYETIRRVREEFPRVHTVCGLSNVSFGLPARKLINQAFLIQAMAAGLDAAILDPLDKRLMSLLYAGELLLGRDDYAAGYLAAFRGGRIEV
ncbi:MAG: methyltetrahydrofolate cobalamin methyltransferase [Firmicutes bacterium]|nr:methyltetrahydrofolate cobalamin methyltransferase [Bacillota bacterium]